MTEKRDKLGRTRHASQGGAGPKHLPQATGGKVTGELTDLDMPEDLGTHAVAFWTAASQSMRAIGILERADRLALAIAARTWQRYMEAQELLARVENYFNTNGGKGRHPAMITVEKAEKTLLTYFSDFGLTPSARSKFGPIADNDPFAELMRGMQPAAS